MEPQEVRSTGTAAGAGSATTRTAAGVVSTGGAGGGTTGSIGNPKGATLTPLGAPDSFS